MLLGDLYKHQLQKTPGKEAIIFKGNSYSYAQFDESVRQSARALLVSGMGRGSRVALFMKNCAEMVELYFACFKIGAIAVPLNYRYMKDEVVYAANHCSAGLFIADGELIQRVRDIRKEVPSVKQIHTYGADSGNERNSWKGVKEGASNNYEWPEVSEEDPAIILYTSGSTNKPKGVTYTHAGIFNICSSRKITQELNEQDISLAATAICHVGGSVGVTFPIMYAGGTVIILEKPDPLLFLECLEAYRPTRAVLLPAQLIDILEHTKAEEVDFSSLKEVECGGDYISTDLYEHFRNTAGFELNQIYGLTECEGACFTPPSVTIKRGSIGRPRHGVEIRLVKDNGKEAGTGELGEILIKSDSVMAEYWNDEENTSLTFKDGWLRTGDTGRVDESGYCYYMGRIKELIIKGGSNVAPGEVEEVLDDHPGVSLSGVVGVPHERYGELIHIFIETKPGLEYPPEEADLRSYTSERLAAYKVPDRWTFVEKLPRNDVGKIDRRGLHALAVKLDAD